MEEGESVENPMSLQTRNPTSNQTPDPGQGGAAVTGNINTGHGSTALSASGGDKSFATCLWSGFPATGGQIISVALKADWSQSGSLTGAGSGLTDLQLSTV